MNTYSAVKQKIEEWEKSGLSKSNIVVNAANACIGWPYVYASRGDQCTPENRRDYYYSKKIEDIKTKCKNFNGDKGCSGCVWYPGGTVLCFDCRGFTYWLFKLVDIKIEGQGATSQYDNDKNWSEKGPIENMPMDKVCCVFRYDSDTGKMEHTLLYDGNGNYIHCSGEVKKVKISKYKATHYAIPKGLGGGAAPMPEYTEKATVYAENGKPVKMRAKPSTSCKTYWDISCGTVVDVLKAGDDWTQISDGRHEGYMMTQFLKFEYDTKPDPSLIKEPVDLVIPNLTIAEANKLIELYPDAYMTVG